MKSYAEKFEPNKIYQSRSVPLTTFTLFRSLSQKHTQLSKPDFTHRPMISPEIRKCVAHHFFVSFKSAIPQFIVGKSKSVVFRQCGTKKAEIPMTISIFRVTWCTLHVLCFHTERHWSHAFCSGRIHDVDWGSIHGLQRFIVNCRICISGKQRVVSNVEAHPSSLRLLWCLTKQKFNHSNGEVHASKRNHDLNRNLTVAIKQRNQHKCDADEEFEKWILRKAKWNAMSAPKPAGMLHSNCPFKSQQQLSAVHPSCETQPRGCPQPAVSRMRDKENYGSVTFSTSIILNFLSRRTLKLNRGKNIPRQKSKEIEPYELRWKITVKIFFVWWNETNMQPVSCHPTRNWNTNVHFWRFSARVKDSC